MQQQLCGVRYISTVQESVDRMLAQEAYLFLKSLHTYRKCQRK